MIRPRTLITTLLLTSTPTPAFAKPPPDAEAPEALIELRSELFKAGPEQAQQEVPRFRALCDADGYPLVGNAVRKTDVYQPSQFCEALRASTTAT
ncbi:hypothetical protein ACNOYE_31335 [Nannocystaceae bacterium ST9]